MAAIFFASSLPNLTSLPGDINDKIGHFLGYGLLSMLVLFARASGRWTGVTISSAAWATVFTTAYGATDELHQRFVPGRSPALDDIVADFAGAVAGAACILAWRWVRDRRRTRDV